MKKSIVFVIIITFLFSCNQKHGNMLVKGKINNFQKGKVFLEKVKDTLLIKVDSVVLDGTNESCVGQIFTNCLNQVQLG